MNAPNNVYVVDDDEAVRDALAMLLEELTRRGVWLP